MAKEKKEKKKGGCFGTLLKIILVIIILFAALVGLMRFTKWRDDQKDRAEREASYSENYWPTDGLATMLPEPEMEYGILNSKSEDYLSVTTGYTLSDDFETYITACSEAGFTVDYYQSTTMYRAANTEGYSLSLYFTEEDEEMEIHLSVPSEPESETEGAVETTTEAPIVETQSQTEAVEASGDLVDGMRPEFKAAMDEYEEFFDEYCEFMTTYAESDNVLSMATQYASFLSQYTETMEALEDWEDEEMNDVETAYYAEVTTRITEKLLTVAATTE